jgi:hypothetical protein
VQGGDRLVYCHPDFPESLIKVGKPKSPARPTARFGAYVARLFPSLATRSLRLEIKAYVEARLQPGEAGGSFPVAELRGLIETDVGIAVVVERIARSGELLGPTLQSLAGGEKALSDDHIALLTEFARELFAWKIRAGDLNPRNIVLGEGDGRERFVLVDGLGNVTLVPLNSWSDVANATELDRGLSALARRLGLTWNRKDRAFSRR